MQSVVIDASVALKWYLEGEEDQEQALSLLKRIQEGKLQLIVPELWFYELTNAFKNNVDSKRINIKTTKVFLKDLSNLNLVTIDFSSILEQTFDTAVKFNISAYDASYVALAKDQNLPFYTADKKLLEKVSTYSKAYYLAEIQV